MIVNPVCSVCGAPMPTPEIGESYLCPCSEKHDLVNHTTAPKGPYSESPFIPDIPPGLQAWDLRERHLVDLLNTTVEVIEKNLPNGTRIKACGMIQEYLPRVLARLIIHEDLHEEAKKACKKNFPSQHTNATKNRIY